jgi:hypothetical protein
MQIGNQWKKDYRQMKEKGTMKGPKGLAGYRLHSGLSGSRGPVVRGL